MNSLPEKNKPVYAGLDIAKATLQLHLQGRQHALPNTAPGHARLLKLLRGVEGGHVVCEATGGYERAVVAALHAAGLPVSIVNPARVRHFAQAQGRRAKNDPIDAATLTDFGVNAAVPQVWRMGVRSGRFLPELDPDQSAPVAVLGPRLKRELFGDQNCLGRHVRIAGQRFLVIGVMLAWALLATWNEDTRRFSAL